MIHFGPEYPLLFNLLPGRELQPVLLPLQQVDLGPEVGPLLPHAHQLLYEHGQLEVGGSVEDARVPGGGGVVRVDALQLHHSRLNGRPADLALKMG